MNNHDFKGNAPENPNVVQLISFLYVGVAELNDGHLSDNEILKMVEKHKSYGLLQIMRSSTYRYCSHHNRYYE